MVDDVEASEHDLADRLWRVIPPIMIVVGTFGNILAVVVLLKRKNRNSPTAFFLTCLATCDLLALWTGLLRQWLVYMFVFDLRNTSTTVCKVHAFMVNFSLQSSSWFLIALTVERCLSVTMPHRVRHICRVQIAIVSSVMIIFVIVIVNMHWFWTHEVTRRNICYGNAMYSHNYWIVVDLCVFNIIPAIVLIIGNACIIIRMLMRMRASNTRINPAPIGRNPQVVSIVSGNDPSNRGRRRTESFPQMTVILICLSAFFLVCTMPIGVLITVKKVTTSVDGKAVDLWWAVTNLLMYLNNTLNFLLYFLSGSRFRNDVKDVFCGPRVQPPLNNDNQRRI